MTKAPTFYRVNSQQFISIDCIEVVDDLGWDVKVTMKSGRDFRIGGLQRQGFLAIIEAQSDKD